MITACISDMHGLIEDLQIPECDLLIIAGDICPASNHEAAWQANWLKDHFADWLAAVPAKNIVGIAGNHDFVFQYAKKWTIELPWHYLYNDSVEIEGLKIWGSPWSPWFNNWAFNFPTGDRGTKQASMLYNTIPDDTDIVITHGPPKGLGDYVCWDGKQVGCPILLTRMYEVQPKLHVFGHIHGSTGVYESAGIKFINASVLSENYELTKKPIMTVL